MTPEEIAAKAAANASQAAPQGAAVTPEAIARRAAGGPIPYANANNAEYTRKRLEALAMSGTITPGEQRALDALNAAAPANQDAMGEMGATYRGGLQGVSFQHADELYGLFGGDKAAMRAANAEAARAYPEAYGKGKTGGALLSGLALGAATGPLGAGRTLGSTIWKNAALGSAEGALWGAGEGEGMDKVGNALDAGETGALWGAAAPAVVGAASYGGRILGDIGMGALNLGNKGRANRAMAQTLERSGKTIDEVAADVARAAARGQPEYRMMDAMGHAGRSRANGVARGGSDGAEEIKEFLEQRQLDQTDRVGAFVEDAFDLGGTTAKRTADELTQNRDDVAKKMYGLARETGGPVDVRGALDVIDARVAPMRGSGIKMNDIDLIYEKYRSQLMAVDPLSGENARYLSDFGRVLDLKEVMGDAITAAYQSGNRKTALAIKAIYDQLDLALESSSDVYRFANDNYRDASRIIEAVDEGADMAKRGRAADNIDQFEGMNDNQQRAARVGYGDHRLDVAERNAAETADKARPFQATKAKSEAAAIANDPDLFLERIAGEREMWKTQHAALGGSQTANNIADQEDVGAIADGLRAGQQALAGNAGNAISKVADIVADVATGQNAATRELIANILMSDNPKKAMAEAMRATKSAADRRWLAQAVTRALSRRFVEEKRR